MNIKFAGDGRVAGHRLVLGLALHAVWRGLVWFFVPEDFGSRRSRGSL